MNNRRYSKKYTEKKCVCFNDIWSMAIKTGLKIKNRSQKFDINRPKPRHGPQKPKYKMYLSIMMFICIKQHLSYIRNSIHEKVKQHWGWVKKGVAYKKSLWIKCSFNPDIKKKKVMYWFHRIIRDERNLKKIKYFQRRFSA